MSCQDAILVEQAIQYHIKNLPSQVPVEQNEDDSIHYCCYHTLGMHRIHTYKSPGHGTTLGTVNRTRLALDKSPNVIIF